ncbi:hypothetical protein ACFY12_14775 [Streptomyces sp. NPDC001339]|uniref:hypothetical protein n=1 Tax=Streptomyces sp. NPDC001339 TaxID=3364563 RepID=UPI00368B7A2F
MPNCIARLFEPLLRLLLPARGRHRSTAALPVALCEDAATFALPRVTRQPVEVPLRGEDTPLIRPYVLTPEERRERRLQRGRRRALWLAELGYDAGPRWIHGVEVAG